MSLITKWHTVVPADIGGTRNIPKPCSKTSICAFFVEFESRTKTSQCRFRQGWELRKVCYLVFVGVGMRRSQFRGKSATHGIAINKHFYLRHREAVLWTLQEKLFVLLAMFIKVGTFAPFPRPHVQKIMVISSNNWLNSKECEILRFGFRKLQSPVFFTYTIPKRKRLCRHFLHICWCLILF